MWAFIYKEGEGSTVAPTKGWAGRLTVTGGPLLTNGCLLGGGSPGVAPCGTNRWRSGSSCLHRPYYTLSRKVRQGFPGGAVVKGLPANARGRQDLGLIPGLGRSPGGGNGNPPQYSCLEKPMDRGAWWATVHGVEKSRSRRLQVRSDWTQTHTHTHTHAER